jgi:hypothetical protein
MSHEKKPYLMLRHPQAGSGGYLVEYDARLIGQTVHSELADLDEGDTVEVEVVYYTDAEVENLPEFGGW